MNLNLVSYLQCLDWRIAEYLKKIPLKTAQFYRVDFFHQKLTFVIKNLTDAM